MDTIETVSHLMDGVEAVGINVPWRPADPVFRGGENDSKSRGESGYDLAGFATCEGGDRLDARATAKTGWNERLAAVFDQPREVTVFALIEDSVSIDFGQVSQTKKELASRLMACVLVNTAWSRDLAGYAVWSRQDLRRFKEAQSAGRMMSAALVDYIEPDGDGDDFDRTDESGLGQALSRLPRDQRCLVFVISDCHDRNAADEEALELAAALHDIVFLLVGDSRERELPARGSGFHDIEDLEDGQTATVFLSRKTRLAWRQDFDRLRKALKMRLFDLGAAVEEFWTHESGDEINEKLVPIFLGARPDANSEEVIR